jgi:predicted RNA methylase
MTKFRKALTTYSDYYEMMSDEIRMKNFREAIFATVSEGDVVLDLGSGLGILGFWALEAGASKVYAVEKSDAIFLAKDLAKKNNFYDRIEFINSDSKSIAISEKVDLIISETLGSFGIEENTVDYVIDVRDRFLKENGRMIPQAMNVYLCPCENYISHEKSQFWSHVNGLDFSSVTDLVLSRMQVDDIKMDQLLSEPQCFTRLNLYNTNEKEFDNQLLFKVNKSGVVHGMAGWFACDLNGDLHFATSPSDVVTHWKQAYFPFTESVKVKENDFLEFSMKCQPKLDGSDNMSVTYDYRCTQI